MSQFVKPGSIVITDGWAAYKSVCRNLNLQHLVVNHKEGFVDKITGACKNAMKGTWNGVKQTNPPRYGKKNYHNKLYSNIYGEERTNIIFGKHLSKS